MRGQEPLIAMRRSGQLPTHVVLETTGDPNRYWRTWRDDGIAPQLLIDPEETIGRLDLRCLVGLFVEVHGEDETRVDKVVHACISAGAKRVIGIFSTPERETYRVQRITDTEGTMQWPA